MAGDDDSVTNILFDACFLGDVDIVKSCLSAGANVNKSFDHGLTALHAAIAGNGQIGSKIQIAIVTELLSRQDIDIGAKMFLPSAGGSITALHLACKHGIADIIPVLGTDRRMTVSCLTA